MDLESLRLLEAVARLGTITAAAAELHVSQPALSRSLARLESELGHPLFDRPGRRLVLNAAGRAALVHAEAILREERAMRLAVDDVVRRSSALRVGTVAPAPLWRLTALTVERFPGRLLTSSSLTELEVESGVLDGSLDLGIALRPHTLPTVGSTRLMVENLSVCLPSGHPLAGRAGLSARELDGETFLLLEGIGFWRDVCDELFPSSQLVVQQDRSVFEQLAATSDLAFFVTDAPSLSLGGADRAVVPIRDAAAHATFYLLCREGARAQAREVFEWVRTR
ncbi:MULTISPECIES: LysR family transcriptional regulator [unclassified Actinomyces]|uniref:LysR family transcriptional regulator n=1 Tax=unclassified Actinomyces TaxID=2609248 RepID=UPI002016FD5F|nr:MULTISPECIES: LysR family transcriptional regulator [unclassified Actinomyces]MCL3777637.1 LysR family transcriptional regulator [Actinomyces sp. AC-20-1]MCL3790020.1 LysR family transcriptional regulator [Actinomyces sp. 187325]MCL3792417.1 LysR family transcriptional regulator [Actinomyces sp. 186855]MCL3794838.1 LysR family transcriptional regulator [Actinomyces sp. 217892]